MPDEREKEDKENWFKKTENWWIIAGFLVATCGVSIPFLILTFLDIEKLKSKFEDLGVIGDFFGGTTVGLLSLTSILFVTAAIIMQKKELELQRKEVEKTRQEYEVTNKTMKKQQFDSTFFNMINLHHSITKDISIGNANGRGAMKEYLDRIRKAYFEDVQKEYSSETKQNILSGDINLLDELIKHEFMHLRIQRFIESKTKNYLRFDGFEEQEDFQIRLVNNTDKELEKTKVVLQQKYQDTIYNNIDEYKSWLDQLDLSTSYYSTHYIDKFRHEFFEEPLKRLKMQAYEKAFNQLEDQVGHYLRNLYHIVKLIDEQEFDENEPENNKERKKYRAILRAQLSTHELMVVFYNVVYSKKGEPFKELLKNKKFFDDHLSEKDFIWKNDILELEQLDRLDVSKGYN